jgi:hypothetical protein
MAGDFGTLTELRSPRLFFLSESGGRMKHAVEHQSRHLPWCHALEGNASGVGCDTYGSATGGLTQWTEPSHSLMTMCWSTT